MGVRPGAGAARAGIRAGAGALGWPETRWTGSPWCRGGTRRSASRDPAATRGRERCRRRHRPGWPTPETDPAPATAAIPTAGNPCSSRVAACSPASPPGWGRTGNGADQHGKRRGLGRAVGAGRALVVADRVADPAGYRARLQVVTESGPPCWCVSAAAGLAARGGVRLMGWNNPSVPWTELERALSGPATQARAEDAAGRCGTDELSEATAPAPRPAAGRTLHPRAVRRAALPLRVQLPGRRLRPRRCWWRRRSGSAWMPWRSPTTTGSTASSGSPRRPRTPPLRTLYGAELSLGLPEPQLGVADPVGDHLLVLARGQEGYTRLSEQISQRPAARRREGPADLRPGRAGRRPPTTSWLILTGCRKGGVRRALRARRPGCRRAPRSVPLMDRFGRHNVAGRAHHAAAADRRRGQRRAGRARRRAGAAGGRHHRRALRRPARRPGWPRRWPRCAARRSLDEADPYLPPGPGRTCGPARRWRRCSPATRRRCPTAAADRRGVLVRPASGRAEPAALRRAARSRRELLAPRAHHARRRPAVRLAGRATRDAYAQIEKELRIIAEAELPRLLPDRVRHRPVLPRSARSCARAGDRPRTPRSATRWASPRWTRCSYQLLFERFLAPERDGPPDIDIDIESDRARGGHPVRLRHVRPRRTPPRWPTSTPSGRGWRCGTWPRRSATRPASRTRTPSSSTAGRRWPRRCRTRGGHGGIRTPFPRRPRSGRPDPGLPAASRHPLRRNGDLRPAGRAGLPGGVGADGEPLGAAVGQGRLRRHGPGQVRPARARHAVRAALRGRPGPRARGHRGRLRQAGSGGTRGLRDAAAGRLGGGVPGRVPGADGHPAAAANRAPSTTWWWRSR